MVSVYAPLCSKLVKIFSKQASRKKILSCKSPYVKCNLLIHWSIENRLMWLPKCAMVQNFVKMYSSYQKWKTIYSFYFYYIPFEIPISICRPKFDTLEHLMSNHADDLIQLWSQLKTSFLSLPYDLALSSSVPTSLMTSPFGRLHKYQKVKLLFWLNSDP